MSEATIEIPVDHVEAIRRSLLARRDDAESPDEIDALLAQLAECASRAGTLSLSGSQSLLWSVVYDSLCSAAEQLAEECNEYWRGTVTADSARAGVADVGMRLELLIGLGAPPRG